MIYQVVNILSTKTDLRYNRDAYIVVKGTMDLLAAAANENDKAEINVSFKNNAPFRSCISKITVQ